MDAERRPVHRGAMTDWRPLYERAATQHRVITRSQAADLGIPPTTFDHRVRREDWPCPYPGVRIVPGGRTGRHTTAAAALARIGERGALARTWAGWLHGLVAVPTTSVEIVLPASSRAPRDRGLTVVRSRTLEVADLTAVDGLRTTTPTRTFLDLAATCDRERLRELLIVAQQRRLTTVDDVATRLLGVGPITGRGALLRACADLDPERVDSVFEFDVRARLRAAGYRPAPHPLVVTVPGRRIQIDIVFHEHQVGIECDGFAYHARASDLDRDARRHNLLALDGWLVLRLTWQRVAREWPGFLVELDRALARQR